MTTTPPTPTTVEPGQVWRDNDQRSRGAGEFVVWAVVHPGKVERLEEPPAAWPRAERLIEQAIRDAGGLAHVYPGDVIAYRRETDRLVRIRIDRLEFGRDYELIGKSR